MTPARVRRAAQRIARRQGAPWTLLRVREDYDETTRRATVRVEAVGVRARAFRARKQSDLEPVVLVEATRLTLAVPVDQLGERPRPGDRLVEGHVVAGAVVLGEPVEPEDPESLAALGASISAVDQVAGEWLLEVEDR